MKAIICFAAIIAVAVAYPAQEGAAYTNEAIRQAQSSHLIPQNAQIQKVDEGIELSALENIPGNQRVDLFSLLGSQFPLEVVQNLQRQIDSVGRN
ncbi:uncharacterized protein LOC129566941 [Sitodiplosis mosellana]|uniref:uncharacterized protein LOC129566941 n=1 Tax=Sitodiplosis mosellana TaxID=263140 RepID=UPI002444D6BD|nr:uncharacterized protein LOC129566941 [Sitodiplosis mosellana]